MIDESCCGICEWFKDITAHWSECETCIAPVPTWVTTCPFVHENDGKDCPCFKKKKERK